MQEDRGLQHNARDSAILHGGDQRKTLRTKDSKESKEMASYNMASHVGGRKAQMDQREAFKEVSRKRRADSSKDLPIRRKRGGSGFHQPRSMHLRDEAWLRKEIHVPTTSDYPDVPEKFFKQPKSSLFDAIQGLSDLKSTFTTLAREVYLCTLRYESLARNVVVEGEGRSKVRPNLCYSIRRC